MNQLEELYGQILTESGLARIWNHILEHDCAIITAWRGQKINCLQSIDDKPDGAKYTREEKDRRNQKLYPVLMGLGYSVTRVDGTYFENYGVKDAEKEVHENCFFTVNRNNDPKFISNIINLGKKFCQDSVIIKEKNTEDAYLYGTNLHDFPGLDKTVSSGIFKGGVKGEFMTKISGRPFVFTARESYNAITNGYSFEKERQEFLKSITN